MTIYFTTLTDLGETKLANAFALGVPLPISDMAIGDGGGDVPVPDKAQTALVNEVRRAPLNSLGPDEINPTALLAEQVIPAEVGGWWIRELGLYDKDGDLIAVGNCPPTYKPLLTEGSGRTQILRMLIAVSSTEAVELKIDPSVVLATREYVDNALLGAAVSVSLDGPVQVYAGSVNSYTITNYHSLSEYQVSTDLGEASITGDTITLLLADTDTQSPATLRVIRDGILNSFDIEVIEKSIAQPQILTPVNDATDVAAPVIVTSSEYESRPAGIGTHSKSHWKLTSDFAGTNIVWESFDDETNLDELELDSSIVDRDITYYIHVRYFSAALGYSEWSLPSKFTTAAAFSFDPGSLIDGDIVVGIYNGYYLLVAPAQQRIFAKWSDKNTVTGVLNPNDGSINTAALVDLDENSIDQTFAAAVHCDNIGYYLPSINELSVITREIAELIDAADPSSGVYSPYKITAENTGTVHASSSTESSIINARYLSLDSFSSQSISKSINALILPFKRIPI